MKNKMPYSPVATRKLVKQLQSLARPSGYVSLGNRPPTPARTNQSDCGKTKEIVMMRCILVLFGREAMHGEHRAQCNVGGEDVTIAMRDLLTCGANGALALTHKYQIRNNGTSVSIFIRDDQSKESPSAVRHVCQIKNRDKCRSPNRFEGDAQEE